MAKKQLNYNHLYYFYVVALEGGVGKAAEKLHVTPQTVSGQIMAMESYLDAPLFTREGKRLFLNELGKLVYSYAEDIFTLGDELSHVISSQQLGLKLTLTVGVIDVIPKVFAFDLLKQSFGQDQAIHLVCHSGDFESLLGELALNKLDLIISDRPLPPSVSVKAFSHYLGESGMTFFASPDMASTLSDEFPACIDGRPFIIPGDKSAQKNRLLTWFDQQGLHPDIVAEFDDTALMKFFGQDGLGIFAAPTSIKRFVLDQFNVRVVGESNEVTEQFYGISPERKIKHPVVEEIFAEAKRITQAMVDSAGKTRRGGYPR